MHLHFSCPERAGSILPRGTVPVLGTTIAPWRMLEARMMQE